MRIRGKQAFVPVDCSALAPTLIESELYGHSRRAFTGVSRARQGLFEVANEGTLFFDEVGNLPLDLQAKLLRAVQAKEIRPVGSTWRIPIIVQVIAATNRDLEAAIRNGGFRQDLYFRLHVVQIKLPSLRERKSDIPLLVDHFLEKFFDPLRPVRLVSEDAMARLMTHDWPGNVRELENAIESTIALGSGPILSECDLPEKIQSRAAASFAESNKIVSLEEIKRRAIYRALGQAKGDRLAAAHLLGIGKTTLYRKLKQYSRNCA
jgi:transcriptional regulator with PAS, ATPase and Fis domain